jgi:hypothetical protein
MIPLVEKSKRTESEGDDAPILQTQWPVVSEEYFEYADVLDAVTEYTQLNEKQGGNRPFAFVEIGAGYGHWTFAAHRALMQKAPEASYRYLGGRCERANPRSEKLSFSERSEDDG